MARAKKKQPRRKPQGFSILNAAESYAYLSIITEGAMSGSPAQVLFGEKDVRSGLSQSAVYNNALADGYGGKGDASGLVPISLGDIAAEPGTALAAIQGNLMRTGKDVIVKSFFTGITFKFGKKLMRSQISNINRNLMRPIFGRAVRL